MTEQEFKDGYNKMDVAEQNHCIRLLRENGGGELLGWALDNHIFSLQEKAKESHRVVMIAAKKKASEEKMRSIYGAD